MFGKKSDSKKAKAPRSKQADQLFKACELGRTNDVHKLLQISGTSYHINVMNDNGLTPLHLAAESATTASDANMFNYLSICKMLLDAGADPNVGTLDSLHNESGRLVFIGSRYIGSQAPQNTILHYLSKILIPPSNASLKIFLETLLTYALSKGGDSNKGAGSLILSSSAYIRHAANREGLSPLHEAAIKGNVDVISFFLNQGGNPNAKSKNGETALHFAVVSSNEEAVKVLLAKGADPDAPAERGTPREISKKLRLPIIEKLISASPVKPKPLASSGNIQSSGSGISSKAPAFSPPPDLPPPPPPGVPDGDSDRSSFALDENALNDLITKISDPPSGPGDRVSASNKPLPAPPGKKAPAAADSPRMNGKEELNDLLDELDFGENDDPVLPASIEEEYDENDMPDIKFQLDPITSKMCVRAASLDKLVERFSQDRDPASGFRSTLLLTYRSYIKGQELMRKMVTRFKKCGFESTQIRILEIFKQWLEMHFYDFQEDDQLRAILFDFLDRDVKNPSHRSLAGEIKSTYRDQKDFSFTSTLSVGLGGGMAISSPLQFLTMDEAEVARQLTLVESEIYCAIKPKEILDGAWNKKDKEMIAQHVVALILHFNNVSRWVVTEIVNQTSPKQRAAMIEKMIYLGTEMRELGNFNGGMEVLAALNSPAVTRLKKTWEMVGEDAQARLDAIQQLMSHTGSYKAYRLVLRDVDPPCLPYLGMYLSDITFIQDGEPNVVDGHLINFAKHHKVAQVIGEIQFFQESGHSGKNPKFASVPAVVDWWRAQLGNLYSEKEALQMSLQVEPDQEGAMVDTGAMAQMKQENEGLQIRVSQLEQLNREQADEISVLTEKLKAAQREIRVAKDVADMLRAAQAANRGAPAPPTVASMSFEPPPNKFKSTPLAPTPAPPPEMPPPGPDFDLPPDLPPPIPDALPPETAPPEPAYKATATPTPAVTRTNDRLQELREKYRARQGAPAAEPAKPEPAKPAATTKKAAASAPVAVNAVAKKGAAKAAALMAPATPEPVESGTPPAGSTAAALREKFKLNSKGSSPGITSPAVLHLKEEGRAGSSPGARSSSSGDETAEAGAPAAGGDAEALLASMAALREKYKKPAAPGAKTAAVPVPASPTTATVATPTGSPKPSPKLAPKPATTAATPTPKPSPRPKPQSVAAPTEEAPAEVDAPAPVSPRPKGRPLPKMTSEPKIIMMKAMAPRPKPPPQQEEEPEVPEQQWEDN